MTASGVYTFNPTVALIIDEAAERAGLDPASLQSRHLLSARNSLNFVYKELEAENLDTFYRIDYETTSLAASAYTISLPSGSIEVMNAWVTVNSSDRPLTRISRQDYDNLPVKTQTGSFPTMFWINHESGSPVMTLWPVPTATVTVSYDRLRAIQDAITLSETTDTHRLWWDVLAYGVAMRLCEKFNPERFTLNARRFAETKAKATGALVTRGPVIVYGRAGSRARTRRA